MNKLLILSYVVIIHIIFCFGDCGTPGQQAHVDVYGSKGKSKEGDQVEYECKDYYRQIGGTRRRCQNGKWTGEVPRCAKFLENDLTVENITISYILNGQEKSDRQEINNISQLLTDFNNRGKCLRFNESAHIQFNLTFSPPTQISSIEIFYLNRNEKQNNGKYIPPIKPFINSYRNCVRIISYYYGQPYDNQRQIEFLCDVKNFDQDHFLEEKMNLPNTVSFELPFSNIPHQISICQVNFYQIPDICGRPDVPLHASTQILQLNTNSERRIVFNPEDRERYQVLGEDTIDCKSDGKWFPSPPMVKPLINCPIDPIYQQIFGNTSQYTFEMKDFDYFNETIVATIDTRLIFKCIDKENKTSQASNQILSSGEILEKKPASGALRQFVQYCDKNGKWNGQTPDCEIEKNVNNTNGNQFNNNQEGNNSLIIILISLVTLFGLIVIAVCIFGAYFIWKKKKLNQVSKKRKMNEEKLRDSSGNKIYYEDGETYRRRSDENMYETISLENMYEVPKREDDYDELNLERYERIENHVKDTKGRDSQIKESKIGNIYIELNE